MRIESKTVHKTGHPAFNNDANMFAHIRSTHKGIKRKK